MSCSVERLASRFDWLNGGIPRVAAAVLVRCDDRRSSTAAHLAVSSKILEMKKNRQLHRVDQPPQLRAKNLVDVTAMRTPSQLLVLSTQ